MDTGAGVSIVLGKKFYNKLKSKPTSRNISLCCTPELEPNLGIYVAGPFNISVGQRTHQVDQYVAPIKDWMQLGMDILRNRKVSWTLSTVSSPCVGKISR